jgi:16S rRNA (cytidine1402-2'-O)-methyltransferase
MPDTVTVSAELILASSSPYRRELLQRLGLPFETLSPQVDERPLEAESPRDAAIRLARAKALAGAEAAAAAGRTALVIGSDQTATLDGRGIIGKPGSHERATTQLRAASGRTMVFHTAFALARSDGSLIAAHDVETRVRFRQLDDATIEAYLQAERPYDCAGSAKAEGLGLALLAAIESPDPTALIGLPLIALTEALCRAGMPPLPGLGAADGRRPGGSAAEPEATWPSGQDTRPAGPGRLYLIPTPLGDRSDPRRLLAADSLAIVARLRHFVVENAKNARAFLKAAGTDAPLQALQLVELNTNTPPDAVAGMLAPLHAGEDLGLLSDAGCPAVADPGAVLVAAAHAAGIRVVPLVGPSALLLALMASGLNGQRFAFAGYLPAQPEARAARLRELERRSASNDETQVWIETPYRNRQMLDTALACLSSETRLTVASELTLDAESIVTRRVADWRTHPLELPREPAVFALLAAPTRAGHGGGKKSDRKTGQERSGRLSEEATQATRRRAPGQGSRRR